MDNVFHALSAPVRRLIIDELCERDGQTLFELCSRLTMRHQVNLSRQAVSQHLDVLEGAGLLHTRREGRYKFHDLDLEPLHRAVDGWLVRPTDQDHR
ncbi:helix-turn-helix transcriptional regulator [Microlunatus elymi]|uniref:Helix-turn-helix transcriptional regulator n=1 Tax=Microlunatus elymi TaxID=2596828 RepID=A0A516Q424_9ACTN|nr:helix-turn-helix domain-containing protein [Microlunatus elymi]QDP98168.1 helix-turn-helix transcriptional regulator [Microlunatus elymi]